MAEATHVLLGCEMRFQGDAGYQGIEKREETQGLPIQTWAVSMRPGKLKKLVETGGELGKQLKAVARELASRRAKVEHVFRDLKVRFGYAKVRYRGLAKSCNRFHLLAALANVIRAKYYEYRKGLVTP